jgi:hypothetical protein
VPSAPNAASAADGDAGPAGRSETACMGGVHTECTQIHWPIALLPAREQPQRRPLCCLFITGGNIEKGQIACIRVEFEMVRVRDVCLRCYALWPHGLAAASRRESSRPSGCRCPAGCSRRREKRQRARRRRRRRRAMLRRRASVRFFTSAFFFVRVQRYFALVSCVCRSLPESSAPPSAWPRGLAARMPARPAA